MIPDFVSSIAHVLLDTQTSPVFLVALPITASCFPQDIKSMPVAKMMRILKKELIDIRI
jgi:hypothetical protein